MGDLHIAPEAQRSLRPGHAAHLASVFNLEGMGFPVVSRRNGQWYVVDGFHRVTALRLLDFSPDDTIQCEVYEDFNLQDEAEMFLERNDVLAVSIFDRFRVALTAGRQREMDVDRTVRAQGLRIGDYTPKDDDPPTVSAIGTLLRIYDQGGTNGLGYVLRIVRDAYGAGAFKTEVLTGVALFVERYAGQFDLDTLIERLSATPRGVNGLLQSAEKLRLGTGSSRGTAVAGAIVEAYNTGRGGKKLANWWRA